MQSEFNVGQASSLSRLRDDFGRPVGVIYGDDYVVSYGYDELERFSSGFFSVSAVSFFMSQRIRSACSLSGATVSFNLRQLGEFTERTLHYPG